MPKGTGKGFSRGGALAYRDIVARHAGLGLLDALVETETLYIRSIEMKEGVSEGAR